MQDGFSFFFLMSSFFHFLMSLTTVIACWDLSAAKMWINLPLKTVSELILCSQRTETAALLMCCSHCTSCVDAILTPTYTIAVTEEAKEAAGCLSFSVESGCTRRQCQGWGERIDFKCSNSSHVGCNNWPTAWLQSSCVFGTWENFHWGGKCVFLSLQPSLVTLTSILDKKPEVKGIPLLMCLVSNPTISQPTCHSPKSGTVIPHQANEWWHSNLCNP